MLSSLVNKKIFLRHRRIWIKPEASDSIQFQGEYSHDVKQYVSDWLFEKKPLIGRSRNQFDTKNCEFIPVGLMTYHPDGTKCRVSLLINSNFVLKIEDPLLLSEAMNVLPLNLYLTVNNFFDQFSNLPIIVRVYGSIMWSYEGNISRLNPNSDIDLLIQVTNSCDVDALADRLLKFSQLSKIFLDGEFEFKNGVFVSWREFTSGAKDLLAKTDSGPKLVTRNSVIEIAHT